MKKIIGFVIAFMMFTTTVMANAADGFGEMWKNYYQLKSFSGSIAMNVEVNEPLLFLEDILPNDGTVDYPLMINDLLGSTVTADYSVNVSDDFKKVRMSMVMACDVPVSVNEDFKLDAWVKIRMWIDYDMTDPASPVYKVILKTPLDSKYLVTDMSEKAVDMAEMLTPEAIDTIADSMIKIIENNGDITKTRNGYRIKLDNDGMVEYIAEAFKIGEPFAGNDADREMFAEMISAMDRVKDNLIILGEDGMTVEFIQNGGGDITAAVEEIHFDFNLCDILSLAGTDADGLTRERADVNVTLKEATVLSGHNMTVVEIPELTEENSENMYGGEEPEEDYYYGEDDEFNDFPEAYFMESVYSDQMPYVDSGEVFMPVYDLLGTMYDGEFTITADSLRYTATGENKYGIGEVFAKVGENSVMVDGEAITFEKPVVNEFDIFRVPMEFVKKLGFEMENIWIDNDGTYFTISMPNPEFWKE